MCENAKRKVLLSPSPSVRTARSLSLSAARTTNAQSFPVTSGTDGRTEGGGVSLRIMMQPTGIRARFESGYISAERLYAIRSSRRLSHLSHASKEKPRVTGFLHESVVVVHSPRERSSVPSLCRASCRPSENRGSSCSSSFNHCRRANDRAVTTACRCVHFFTSA